MSITALSRAPAAFVPLRLAGKPQAMRIAAVLAATAFLAVCSWISVPMLPVPITMQTFAVTVVGAVFGWRLGAVAVLAWLAEGALGLPVFATGSGSLASFTGPTAGYLLSFPVAAALVGWCAERGLTARSLLVSFGVMLAANALMLAGGAAWLSQLIGAPRAIAFGVTPFLLGSVLKSGLAATSIEAVRRFLRA